MPILPLTDEKIAELREAFTGEVRVMLPSAALSLLDEVTRARALLRRIEWSGMREGASCCPDCGAFPDTPIRGTHAKDCDLDALIWPRH